MNGVLCTPEQASCLIPNLIVELGPPCPLDGAGGLVLCGWGYKDQKVTIRVLDGVIEVDGVPAEEVEAKYKSGEMTRKEIEDSYRSWRAHASHGNCRNLILDFDQRVQKILSEGRSETRGTKN